MASMYVHPVNTRALPHPFPLAVIALVIGPTSASAQNASAYVPVEHWVNSIVEHLIGSGVVNDPSPLTRPFRIHQLINALRSADLSEASNAERVSIERILQEFVRPSIEAYTDIELYAGASAGTYARRNPLREEGNGVVSPHAGISFGAQFGPLIAASHGFVEERLRDDPDYTGLKNVIIPGRITDSYLSLQGKYGEVFFGSISRNWGPYGLPGFLVSPEPYSYEHFYVRVGNRRARTETVLTELDNFRNQAGHRVRRHWATHRAVFMPVDWLIVTFGQGTLTSGVGRGFELAFVNPLKVTSLTRQDESDPDSTNVMYAGDLYVKLPGSITFQGNFLLDDLSSLFGRSLAPDRIGVSGVIRAPIGRAAAGNAYFTLVSSLTYRSPSGFDESVMRRGIGLGRNFADYVETGLSFSIMPRPLTTIRPELAVLWQGEGDFRRQFPPLPARDHPFLHEGVVERTFRLGLGLQTLSFGSIDLSSDIGLHLISNDRHQEGESRTRFVGRVRITYRYPRHLSL